MTATIIAPDRVKGAGDGQAVILSDGMSLNWDQLILDFRPRLTSYARSRGIREPEDLVQDVFVAAVERLGAFEGDRAALGSLLFTIAYRRIADEHRRGYRRPETLTADHSTLPDPGPSIDEVVDLHVEARLALDAFAVLDAREQRVLEMRLIEEATPAEVAKDLGLSSGNVRVIQARALVKVRHHLQSTFGQGSKFWLPALGTPFEILRGLRDRPARRGLLGEWVEWLRASPRSAALPPTSGGDGRAIFDLLSRAGQTGHTISPLAEPTVAKIGALITVLALGGGVGGHMMGEDEELAAVGPSSVEEAGPGPAARDVDQNIGREMFGVGPVVRIPDQMLPARPEHGAAEGAPPAPEPETVVDDPSPPGPADGTVESDPGEGAGLVGNTEAAVGETVEFVEETLGVVEEVAAMAVEDVVIPAVEDTVDVAQDVITPPIEDVVVPILRLVEASLDDAGEGLGGLLGLP